MTLNHIDMLTVKEVRVYSVKEKELAKLVIKADPTSPHGRVKRVRRVPPNERPTSQEHNANN